MEPTRIVLRERAPRPDLAVRFEPDALVLEGVALLPDRRIALRDVSGIERAGAWLWVGAGLVPALLGGGEAPAERLARVEAELRARIRALPGGGGRLARIDARIPRRLRAPWLTAAAALGLGAAAASAGAFGPRAAAELLLLAAAGLAAEPVLGALRLLAAGAVALGAASLAVQGVAGSAALAPLALALGWAALAAVARLRRADVLSVRARSALDAGLLLAPLLAAHALSTGGPAARAFAASALAGALAAPLLLRRWPDGARPD
jgi:hypothetical protein